MSESARIWQLLGTFLPVYGVALTIVAAIFLSGRWRTWAVVLLPLLTLWLCAVFGERIAYDGNMLFVLLVLLYMLALCLYYPILLICALLQYLRAGH